MYYHVPKREPAPPAATPYFMKTHTTSTCFCTCPGCLECINFPRITWRDSNTCVCTRTSGMLHEFRSEVRPTVHQSHKRSNLNPWKQEIHFLTMRIARKTISPKHRKKNDTGSVRAMNLCLTIAHAVSFLSFRDVLGYSTYPRKHLP